MQTMIELQDAAHTVIKDLRALGFLVTITTDNTTTCGKVAATDNQYHPLVWLNPIDGKYPERVAIFIEQMKELRQKNIKEQ